MILPGTRQLQIRHPADCESMTIVSVVDKATQEAIEGVTEITIRTDLDIVSGHAITKATITIVITDENDIWPVEVVEGSLESVSSLLPVLRM